MLASGPTCVQLQFQDESPGSNHASVSSKRQRSDWGGCGLGLCVCCCHHGPPSPLFLCTFLGLPWPFLIHSGFFFFFRLLTEPHPGTSRRRSASPGDAGDVKQKDRKCLAGCSCVGFGRPSRFLPPRNAWFSPNSERTATPRHFPA